MVDLIERMDIAIIQHAIVGVLVLYGQVHGTLLGKHIRAIEEFVLTGTGQNARNINTVHGYGCDILAIDGADQLGMYENTPKIVVDKDAREKVDLNRGLPNSHCLFVLSHVNSPEALAALVSFGWVMLTQGRYSVMS